ncbi:hypothetical protein GGG87_06525 [Streptococcus sp. zg-86]|uniref:YbjN domain-containing protein n=1 Tax=Streptococcus zhangguiae TaxID=2664091 RepID=A0A6I4RFI6_9STRE|nr:MULTISPECIES: hypothetical protein [unclassified Streptococcus]MTB64647.1 hypothetical protein [Streptococcus sp. zg-86]MTB90957.1 hypothetical protein [Streptococcus sp. zg-36]MWV56620.1 hypothetical protein [Streptococcus sp. zg-70]QTH48580.1 hypothetical protein J5M87_04470 [Streptococcus sp. zg-86]
MLVDSINRAFNAVLLERSFPLKQERIANGIIYKGKIDLGTKAIPFAISVTMEHGQGIAQLIFHPIAYCDSEKERLRWLHFVNEWNDAYGTGYYLCIAKNREVYMRYVLSVSEQTVDQIFQGIILGSNLVKHVAKEIEYQFGTQ